MQGKEASSNWNALVWRFLDTYAAKLLQLLQGFPVWTRKIRDSIFYRRDEQNKEIEEPLLQIDAKDRAESVNILIYQVLEQLYNNKTKASLRSPSLISLWNILRKGFMEMWTGSMTFIYLILTALKKNICIAGIRAP